MLITPNGIIGNTVIAASNQLAACSTFRDELGVGTPQSALTRIHFPYADDRLDESGELFNPRPRAIINPPSMLDFVQRGEGAWTNDSNLYLEFEFLPDPLARGDRNDELTAFCNTLGAILGQFIRLSGQDDPLTGYTYLNLRRVSLIDGPAESELQNENGALFYGARFMLQMIGSI